MKRNKSHIIDNINKTAGISKSKAKQVLDVILQTIKERLADGEKVSLARFGTFDVKTNRPRKYRNISTGKILITTTKRLPVFRPSSSISNLLNNKTKNAPPLSNKRKYFVEDGADCKILFSKPNPEQTDSLKIGYTPISSLVNKDSYPIVLMPQNNSFLKLPREGRSDVRGYKEADFLSDLLGAKLSVTVSDDKHMAILGRTLPYEPDYVLYDHDQGLYIDVEIDEPYDGYSRIPTHVMEGHDSIRDKYFVESGWIVIRFTEHQVHTNPNTCIQLVRHIVNSIQLQDLNSKPVHCVEPELKWTSNQAIIWERNLYREKYLGIQFFSKTIRNLKIICRDKTERIETRIRRTPIHENLGNSGSSISASIKKTPKKNVLPILFDEVSHIYYPPSDPSGSSDYISVTTLIEQFFPHFDVDAYVAKKILETGKTEEEIRKELSDPSDRGTQMHKDIENYLKGEKVREDYKEFKMFECFYNERILAQGLKFYAAEKIIELPQHNIAGTVDALFQKNNGDFVMVDWKRSKHLIIDGYPRKYGFGRGLSVLSHLDNSSYYKYEMQQSFYKYILEKEYKIRISSMILVVLHPDYDKYYPIKLSTYRDKEVKELIEIHDKMIY